MHGWSWAFFQIAKSQLSPKLQFLAKVPTFFHLIWSCHTTHVSYLKLCANLLIFLFYLIFIDLINLNQNKIQILIAWYLFDHYSFQVAWYTQSNSCQVLLCIKYLIWDIFGSLLMEDHIKSWFINSQGFKPKFLT